MLNLPPQPGTTGAVMLALGVCAGLLLFVLARGRVGAQLGGGDRTLVWLVAGALAVTVAGAPFTLWRVVHDIRTTAPVTPEHARYVGAETKLIDGELVEKIGTLIPKGETYYVAVSPRAYVEIRTSLALWLGYALVPRRQTREPGAADWIVAWGTTPAGLGVRTAEPRLVGRNRLSEREPVYLAKAE